MRSLLILPLLLAASAAAAQRPDPNAQPTPPVLVATPAALMIAAMDANGDARVTKAEQTAATEALFKAADTDGDGQLGLLELADWAQTWLGDQSSVPGRFDFDRNGDDRISKAEFVAEIDRRFAAFDRNKDGVVERSELLIIAPRMGRELQQRPAQQRRPGSALPDDR